MHSTANRQSCWWPFTGYLLLALGCWVWWFVLAVGGAAEHLQPGTGFVFPRWVYLTIAIAIFVQYKCMMAMERDIERCGGPVVRYKSKLLLGGPRSHDLGGVTLFPPLRLFKPDKESADD